jgi:hypothetical protein
LGVFVPIQTEAAGLALEHPLGEVKLVPDTPQLEQVFDDG